MDQRRYINLIFVNDRVFSSSLSLAPPRRKIDVDHVLEVAPRCCLCLFFPDTVIQQDEEMIVDKYSADEWDICLGIAEGLLDLYVQSDRIFHVYHIHFNGGKLDELRESLHVETGKTLTSLEKLIATPSTSHLASKEGRDRFICVSEKFYRASKETACANGLIPFQVITANGSICGLCFDHGVPVSKTKEPLTKARNQFFRELREFRFTQRDLFDYIEHKKLIDKYVTFYPEEKKEISGSIGHRGPLGPLGLCSANCINGDYKGEDRCKCMMYLPSYYRSDGIERDYHLEGFLDLSSFDEIKFVKAIIRVMSKSSPRLIERIPDKAQPRPILDYITANAILSKAGGWENREEIFSGTRNSDNVCMTAYVGFIKI